MRSIVRKSLVLGLIAGPLPAGEPTVELLTAPHVRSYVRIVPGETPLVTLDGTDVDYAEPLTFLATGKVKFVVANYNPLTIDAKLDSANSDDPSYAALDKFVNAFVKTFKPATTEAALAKVPSVARPEVAGCGAEQAQELLDGFEAALRLSRIEPKTAKEWADGALGRDGMKTVATDIFGKVAGVESNLKRATQILKELESLRAGLSAKASGVEALRQRVTEAQDELGQAERAFVDVSLERRGATKVTKELEARVDRSLRELSAAKDKVKTAADDLATAPGADECSRIVRALLAAFFNTNPSEQIDELQRLAQSASEVAAALTKTAENNEKWYPPAYGPFGDASANASSKDYVLDSRGPKAGKVVTVTVTARRRTLTIAGGLVQPVDVPKSDSNTVFRVRERSLFAPELGVGLVVASVKTPTYGAVKNEAGATVVSKIKVQERDFKGALVLNAVCRCWNDSFLYPMLQFGIAADADVPAIMMGGGLRFVRPKGLGLAAGGILAWVKDLDKLRIGSTVASQAEIDADLKAQPTVKAYFTVQYSF
jgi:hypothetical protein